MPKPNQPTSQANKHMNLSHCWETSDCAFPHFILLSHRMSAPQKTKSHSTPAPSSWPRHYASACGLNQRITHAWNKPIVHLKNPWSGYFSNEKFLQEVTLEWALRLESSASLLLALPQWAEDYFSTSEAIPTWLKNTRLRKVAPAETERVCSRLSRKSPDRTTHPVKCGVEDKSSSGDDAWACVHRPTASRLCLLVHAAIFCHLLREAWI